jgi:hypothetical protein
MYACFCAFHLRSASVVARAGYDWHWRLDADSVLTAPLQDPIRFLAEHNKLYGYVNTVREEEPCVQGLWEGARQFMAADKSPIQPTFLNEWAEVRGG